MSRAIWCWCTALIVTVSAILTSSSGVAFADGADGKDPLSVGTTLTNDDVGVEATKTDAPSTPAEPTSAPTRTATPTTDPKVEIVPLDASDCVDLDDTSRALDTWCSEPVVRGEVEMTCPDGSALRAPTKARIWTEPDGWSTWRLHTPPCVSSDPGTDDIANELAREIVTLKIPAKHARIAPITDWFAVQTPMTYYTDAGTEQLNVTVLGTAVELELTPTSYAWDPGDGCKPVHATKPGKRYPDQTTTHTYTKVGTYRVTLTTTWHGRFRIAGTTTWHDVEGTGTTTHTTAPFETREIRSVLTS
ncbi:PKD domain-containing protein [Flavimobilis sp. GY10621]|uniref:PKD domain-containing protein n=1 Tax=Flavimobilis rhizosphaerae TaxID=2775421 RepID=A0ABR9DQ69_9MICO|nr:PKD domain-containing protein [Flavimobilis rhizosphaerae]MBD9699272.1 PKD domain-containing protein [Flavimobilis rhizosphaerae]